MNEKMQKQMAKMVDAVQPYCDEQIAAAMTCSHAGSMRAGLFAKFLGGAGASAKTSQLPNPVFIAVGTETVYAFAYKPRGFKFKIKREAARWPRKTISVQSEETSAMCTFVLSVSPGEDYSLEIPILLGGRELAHIFLDALKA